MAARRLAGAAAFRKQLYSCSAGAATGPEIAVRAAQPFPYRTEAKPLSEILVFYTLGPKFKFSKKTTYVQETPEKPQNMYFSTADPVYKV